MLDSGVIQESLSPFSSAAVYVRKQGGSLRFYFDFRSLSKTVPDAHYLPRIDDTFDRLAGSSWFSKLDLKAGYWQVEMEPDDRNFTAFTTGTLGFLNFFACLWVCLIQLRRSRELWSQSWELSILNVVYCT